MQVCIQVIKVSQHSRYTHWLGTQTVPEALDLSPTSATRTCVNVGKLLKFSMPQFTPLYTGDNVLWGLM